MKEALKKIYFKTQISFSIFFLLYLLICLTISVIYSRQHLTEIHPQFYFDFVRNNSLLLFFQNLFLITLIYFSFCYSIIINREDLIVKGGINLTFAQIVSRGLYILIFLTLLFIVGMEFTIPYLENKIENMRNNTIRANNLIESGNLFYKNKKYFDSLRCYEEYIKIIESDPIKERVRELRIKIADEIKKKNSVLITEDTAISNNITDYIQLAEIFFQKQDYLASLYYYQYIYDVNKKKDILQKIENIKEILRYRNSMMTDKEFSDYMEKEFIEIKDIYSLRKQSEKYFYEEDYQKSLFTYIEILKKNQSLRDIVQLQNESFVKLSNVSVELSYLENAKIFSGKNDFVFFLSDKIMLTIDMAKKVLDMDKLENTFYLYGVKIYKFDDNFNIKDVIYAPYGQAKSQLFFTLYCYSLQDKNVEYFPIPEIIEEKYFSQILENVSNEDENYLLSLYDKSNYIYKIKKDVSDSEKIKTAKIIKESKFNIKNIIYDENSKFMDYIFKFPTDINVLYNFSYDYNKALNFSLFKLFQLKDFVIKDQQIVSFSAGFNNNFLKTAITDKISRIFLFFAISLIFIGISWRLRANFIGNVPIYYFVLMIIIPLFIYVIIKIIQVFTTSFYSVLSHSVNFLSLLVICFIVNSIITIFSIVFIATNRS
ncbi:MAG: hypothetical protein A2086_03505 [Spirochaetes bacterium GWD1_27_9]|nr:MAG: hypothetical protein A2Z98_09835 [Spirochaetes bacterium GWB1_27_13]OHD25348.1 MAG: hypothetical protein A2Y34_00055 [Spirochaetes bacterium GWC1_27_15]OHD31122.1 MAG: hypothetical protein A2086_03505 [Spirochaetes bacterium GWD1_27_9]